MAPSSPRWIDISVPIYQGMTCWPGDPPVEIRRALDMDEGAEATVSQLSMGAHTGTHMDAPLHFLRGGVSIDRMPLAATLGPARVVEIQDQESIKPAELEQARIERGERLLFKTNNSAQAWKSNQFVPDFVCLSADGARYLVQRGVQTIGIDYLSVGGFERDGVETHQELLNAGIWIIEGLNLGQVGPGTYDLICLPLRLRGAEGAPARAVLRPL